MARAICVEGNSIVFNIIRITSIIVVILCLVFILILGIDSAKQFAKATKIRSTFKRIFHTVWITAAFTTILFIISIALCAFGHPYTTGNIIVIQICAVCTIILCILLNLVFRLYFTFKDTEYELSECMKWTLIILYSLLLISSVFVVALSSYAYVQRDQITLTLPVGIIWLAAVMVLLYSSTYIIAVTQFANKLLQLTASRATSIRLPQIDDASHGNRKYVRGQFNMHQIRLIEHTTKYVGLLTLGIITSGCTASILGILGGLVFDERWTMRWFQIAYIFVSVDATVNAICLYLQYSFATKYYRRFCKGIHLCCRMMLTRKANKVLSRRYQRAFTERRLSRQQTKQNKEEQDEEEGFFLAIKPSGSFYGKENSEEDVTDDEDEQHLVVKTEMGE